MENININIMLIIVAFFMVFKLVDGYRKGMVKEIISFVSLIILCVVVALIACGVNSYFDGQFFNVFVMVLLLSVVGIVHHLLGLVFFPAKLVSKLPIISSVDRLLGILIGALEVVAILWTVYTLVMMMNMGPIGQMILDYTTDSRILTWFYQHNYIAYGVDLLMERFRFVPLEDIKTFFQ